MGRDLWECPQPQFEGLARQSDWRLAASVIGWSEAFHVSHTLAGRVFEGLAELSSVSQRPSAYSWLALDRPKGRERRVEAGIPADLRSPAGWRIPGTYHLETARPLPGPLPGLPTMSALRTPSIETDFTRSVPTHQTVRPRPAHLDGLPA